MIVASAVTQRRRRSWRRRTAAGSASDVSTPSNSDVSSLSFCESMTVARKPVARAAGAAEVLDRRPALALVHAGRDAADFTDRAADERVVAGRVDRRVLRVRIRRRRRRQIAASRRLSRRGPPPRPARRRRTATASRPRPPRPPGPAEPAEAAAAGLIQLLHLPRAQSLLQLLGKLRRIRRRGERLELSASPTPGGAGRRPCRRDSA